MAEMVMYNGRAVPREGFRAYVFGINGSRKLMNSYGEYEDHISTGTWFPNKERALLAQEKKRKKKGGE